MPFLMKETVVIEDPNELGAKLIRAELMGDDVNILNIVVVDYY